MKCKWSHDTALLRPLSTKLMFSFLCNIYFFFFVTDIYFYVRLWCLNIWLWFWKFKMIYMLSERNYIQMLYNAGFFKCYTCWLNDFANLKWYTWCQKTWYTDGLMVRSLFRISSTLMLDFFRFSKWYDLNHSPIPCACNYPT